MTLVKLTPKSPSGNKNGSSCTKPAETGRGFKLFFYIVYDRHAFACWNRYQEGGTMADYRTFAVDIARESGMF